MYIGLNKENKKKDPKFKVGDHIIISKHKSIFAKLTFKIGQKISLWLKKLEILCRGHMLLVTLTMNKLLKSFM